MHFSFSKNSKRMSQLMLASMKGAFEGSLDSGGIVAILLLCAIGGGRKDCRLLRPPSPYYFRKK